MLLPGHRNCEKVAAGVRELIERGMVFNVVLPLRGERVNDSDHVFGDHSRVFMPGDETPKMAINSVRLRGREYEPLIYIQPLEEDAGVYSVPWMQVFDALQLDMGSTMTLRSAIESWYFKNDKASIYDDPKASLAIRRAVKPPRVKNDELEPDLAVLEWLDQNTTDGGEF